MPLGDAMDVVVPILQGAAARDSGLGVGVARIQADVLVQVLSNNVVLVCSCVALCCPWLHFDAVIHVRRIGNPIAPRSPRARCAWARHPSVVAACTGSHCAGVGVAGGGVVTRSPLGVRRRNRAAVGHLLAYRLLANAVRVTREVGGACVASQSVCKKIRCLVVR